jgi:Flp pilus assembly protein TadD
MGISHRALGEWDSAAASFRRAVDLEPTEEATAALAEILNRQQRFSEAEPLVRDAIEKWPNSARLRLDLGRILMDTDRPREFLEQLLVARQLEPPRAIHFMMGGVAAFMDGDLVEAEKELRKALQLDEKSAPVWRCLGLFMIETGRQADATEYLQTAASLSPNDPDIWSELGGAWNAAGNLEKAEAAFRRALELNSPTAARELARLLVVANRVTEAETLLREAIEREPANTRARDDLARILINLHRPAEALDQLLAIEKLEPGSARHSLRAGLAALMAGDLVTAERQLRAAIDLDQTISEAWIGLGRALSAAGRLAEAIELLGNAPEEAGRARILTGRGDLQAEVGNLSEAVADYEAALKLDGSNTETLFSLAGVLLTQGRVGDAAENATRAIETQPGGEDLVENLGSNLDALFASCTRSQMATYLEPVLEALNRQGRLAAFEQALSLAAFELLRQNESVSEDRFADAIWALENLVAGRMNVSVAVQFLSVGRDYFKHQDRKALMNLSREERALFTKELGIDANA